MRPTHTYICNMENRCVYFYPSSMCLDLCCQTEKKIENDVYTLFSICIMCLSLKSKRIILIKTKLRLKLKVFFSLFSA